MPNKATTTAREAIARFVDGSAPRVVTWLEQLAAKDPKAAFTCWLNLLEFHVPKLARTEVTGKDGGPIQYSPPVVELHPGDKPTSH